MTIVLIDSPKDFRRHIEHDALFPDVGDTIKTGPLSEFLVEVRILNYDAKTVTCLGQFNQV